MRCSAVLVSYMPIQNIAICVQSLNLNVQGHLNHSTKKYFCKISAKNIEVIFCLFLNLQPQLSWSKCSENKTAEFRLLFQKHYKNVTSEYFLRIQSRFLQKQISQNLLPPIETLNFIFAQDPTRILDTTFGRRRPENKNR